MSKKSKELWLIFTLPLIVGAYSILIGLDSNYDLLDYHLANGWSWIHHIPQENFLSGAASYHPKWIDVFYYFSISHLPTILHKFTWGFLQGISLSVLYLIGKSVIPQARYLPGLLIISAFLNPIVLSEIGTGLVDLSLTTLLLITVYLLIYREGAKYYIIANLIAVFVGFSKPSFAPYSAIIIFWLIFTIRTKVMAVVKQSITSLAISLLLSGPYISSLRENKTPNLLVDFGGMFDPIISWSDTRFKPKSFMDWISRFFLPGGKPGVNIEPFYLDFTFSALSLVIFISLFILFIQKSRKPFRQSEIFILILAILGFSLSTLLSGNLRYAIPSILLWPLCAAIIINRTIFERFSEVIIGAVLFLQVLNFTRPVEIYLPMKGKVAIPKTIEWGRSNFWYQAKPPFTVSKGSLILVADPTMSYLASNWNFPYPEVNWLGAYEMLFTSDKVVRNIDKVIRGTDIKEIFVLTFQANREKTSKRLLGVNLTVSDCKEIQSPFVNQWGIWEMCKANITQGSNMNIVKLG